MSFTISKSHSVFSGNEKENLDNIEDKHSANVGAISSELHLKSSMSPKASSQSLDKQVVLRRIWQRKSYNKVKSALEALLGTSSEANNNNNTTASAEEHKWLQQGDTFSAP